MGRHLERKVSDVGFEDYRPGCMRGMLHILDYHYCHSSKKLPLRRKHGRGKHVRCCKNPRTVSFDLYTDEAQEYMSAKAVTLPVEQQAIRTSSTNRITRKAQIKALISKEIFARTRLQQTDPVHQLGHSSNFLAKMDSDLSNPIIILHKSADTAASRLQIPSVSKTPEKLVAHNNSTYHLPGTVNAEDCSKQNQLSAEDAISLENSGNSLYHTLSHAELINREIPCPQFKESVDVLEIFKLNEKLLVEILKNPDIQRTWDPDIQSTHVQLPSKAKVRLRRSGSFPAADCSHIRFVRPSTIEHKQKEMWSFPKEVKSSIGTQEPRSTAFGPLRDFHEKSIDLKASDHGVTSIAQETQLSSLKPSQGSHKHRWQILLMSLFKGLQKKIKYALTESKRESNHVSTNASIYRVSSGCKFSTDEEERPKTLKDNTMNGDGIENPTSFQETNNDLSKGQVPHIRRGSSLKESLDGYARLFEYSFSKEAKWHQYQSKSLKLSSGDKCQSSGLKSFRRRLSLPDIESICHIPNEFSGDALSPRMSNMTGMDPHANANNDIRNHMESASIPEVRKQFKRLDTVEETEIQRSMVERVGSMDNNELSCSSMVSINEGSAMTRELDQDTMEPEMQEQSPQRNQGIGSVITAVGEHEEQSPVSVLETHFLDDRTCQIEFQMSEGPDLDPSHENVENASAMAGARFLHFESNRLEDDADFNYVRDVLEVSGFNGPEFLGTWYSLEQPLSPTLFKALEAYLHKELESSSDDVACICDHLLMFDLINEELLEIYNSLLAYFPKLFSFTQRVSPLPAGKHVFEEVWKRISWYRKSRSAMEQSTEDMVARDWEKRDGWMKLRLDAEDVALDLEDLIFDELVDEVFCSYIRQTAEAR
ncbi:hypothetical protein SADUNF_Sadunf16G0130700 [Salix dunnii]|uniref:DUF4378 domain-containing protein n=1 Tax=Salix dunnii TaxID=1413687 RepID=A0A835JBF4_9ROSI|nr:hypothetical protein SADUNF_Sadunf16G0130700 [Salix dunnii]